jgi:hypothetical protein
MESGSDLAEAQLCQRVECELAYTAASARRLICLHDEYRTRTAHIIDFPARGLRRAEGLAARDHQSICKRISAFELILPGT